MARERDDSADQLYSVSIDGPLPNAPRVRLSDPGLGVSRLVVSAADRVIFRAGTSDEGPSDLFSALEDGSSATTDLSGGLRARQGRVADFMLSPDGATVRYGAVATNLSITASLSSVPVAGATAAAPHIPLGQLLSWHVVVTPDSRMVMFPGLDHGLYAVPLPSGAAPAQRQRSAWPRCSRRYSYATLRSHPQEMPPF